MVVSHNLFTMIGWGRWPASFNSVVFGVARVVLPHLAEDIPQGKAAAGVLPLLLSLGVGLINAACIV